MKNLVAVAVAMTCLCVALIAASYSTNFDDRTAILLAKVSQKVAAVASHSEKVPTLPPALLAAQRAEEVKSKQMKEKILANAAKSALQEYSTMTKKAQLEMHFEDKHIKSLVSSAAKELIAEEQVDKVKQRAARERSNNWIAPNKKKLSPAARWKQKMKEAEAAALDVIEKQDKTTSSSSWQSYASKQRALIQQEQADLKKREKEDSQHIREEIKTGKLTANTALKNSKKIQKAELQKQKQEKIVRAEKMAKAATERIMKRDRESRRINKIAQKQLPALEKDLNSEAKSIASQKHWKHIQKESKVEADKRRAEWLHLVDKAHKRQHLLRIKERTKAHLESSYDHLQKKLHSATEKHIDTQVNNIVGAYSPSAVAKRNLAQKAAAENAQLNHMASEKTENVFHSK